MALSEKTLEKRAIRAGVKASKKLGHVVTPAELLSVKIQTMPAPFRILLVTAGVLACLSGWFAWPWESGVIRFLEFLSGIGLMLFGFFGIRRTLSRVADSLDAVDFAGSIIRVVGEVVTGIDL